MPHPARNNFQQPRQPLMRGGHRPPLNARYWFCICNCICGAMVSMLTSSAVNHWFESQSDNKTKTTKYWY
jgi:3-methyladenine DNA glycosylase/8-oxoguanine DNA glycosylase